METGHANVSASLAILWPVFDGLTMLDANGKLQPGLASSWKAVDDKTWEFTLGDFTWHNGRAVTVQDVTGSLDRYTKVENKFATSALFPSVESYSASGKTITFKMKTVDPIWPTTVGLLMITPIQELNAAGDVEFFRKPIGSGPFKVVDVNFNRSLIFTAADSGHKSPRGLPKLKDLEIQIVPDATARYAALKAGVIDMASGVTPSSSAAAPADGFDLVTAQSNSTVSYLLDTYNGPTANLKVRQAINYAVDKDAMIKGIYNGVGLADGQHLGTTALGYNPNVKPYPYDPAKAKALLAEAGYANGFTLDMTTIIVATMNKDLAEYIASQLKDVGINVNINIKETASWLPENNNNLKNVGLWAQVINWDQTFEAQSVFRYYSTDFTIERGRRMVNDDIDKLYQQAKTTLDRDARGKIYQQIAVMVHEQAPSLFLLQSGSRNAAKKNLFVPDGFSSPTFYSDMSLK